MQSNPEMLQSKPFSPIRSKEMPLFQEVHLKSNGLPPGILRISDRTSRHRYKNVSVLNRVSQHLSPPPCLSTSVMTNADKSCQLPQLVSTSVLSARNAKVMGAISPNHRNHAASNLGRPTKLREFIPTTNTRAKRMSPNIESNRNYLSPRSDENDKV